MCLDDSRLSAGRPWTAWTPASEYAIITATTRAWRMSHDTAWQVATSVIEVILNGQLRKSVSRKLHSTDATLPVGTTSTSRGWTFFTQNSSDERVFNAWRPVQSSKHDIWARDNTSSENVGINSAWASTFWLVLLGPTSWAHRLTDDCSVVSWFGRNCPVKATWSRVFGSETEVFCFGMTELQHQTGRISSSG